MSYRSFVDGPTTGYTNQTFENAQIFMMEDIAALQYPTSYEAEEIADFDGDGKSDILWRSTGGANDVRLLNGTDHLKAFFSLPVADPS